MAVTVGHAFVSAIPDDPADLAAGKVCQQAHWNANHTVTNALDKTGDTMTGTLTSTLGTVTASTPALTATQTWNSGAADFQGIKIDVTATAFLGFNSSILNVSLNGTRVLWVSGYGGVEVQNYVRVGGTSSAYIDHDGANTCRLSGSWMLGRGGGSLGFYGATPVTIPTVTGSRGGNAALASLLTQLATLGLIVDSSS